MTHIDRRTVLATGMAAGIAACTTAPSAGVGPAVVETTAGKVQGLVESGVQGLQGHSLRRIDRRTGKLPRAKTARAVDRRQADDRLRPADAAGRALHRASARRRAPAGCPPPLINNAPTGKQSEDCLVLNVWTPATDNAQRPVLVWLHGGGFSTGSGSSAWYDGVRVAAKQDVVVVTINHRLNVFGYLYLGDLGGGEFRDAASVGMLDCVLALQWVKDNIARFGGDPKRVLIYGESGGGRKTSSMMAMPPAQGLFHRCVVQSGSQLRLDTPAVGMERTEKLLKALNIPKTDLSKLWTVSQDEILAAMPGAVAGSGQFRPVIGSPSFPAHPFDPAAPAMSANVPMIVGSNRTEASVFLGGDPNIVNLDEAALQQRVAALVPAGEGASTVDMYRRIYPEREARRDPLHGLDRPRLFPRHHDPRRPQGGPECSPGLGLPVLSSDAAGRRPLSHAACLRDPVRVRHAVDARPPSAASPPPTRRTSPTA